MQYFIQSAVQCSSITIITHTLVHFSSQRQDLYKDLLTPTSSWCSFWALLGKQVASLKQNFSPRNKEIKGSVHYANQTWEVLQDSQRILSLAPIKLQLPVHNLPKTHYTFQPSCISSVLTQSTGYISFHTSTVCSWGQLTCTAPACSDVLWATASWRVESSTSVLPPCVVLHSEEKGAQDTSATSLLPHTLVTSHCACTYSSSPILASK